MADRQRQSIHPGTPTVRRIVELEREKAELVKALSDVLNDITRPNENWAIGSSVYNARAALAKEGKS